MASVDFPTNAPTLSYGISLSKEYRILTSTFGDGYTQRVGDGINTEIESWNMTWDIITLSEKNILVDFFDARGGYEAINFTAPGDSSEKKWVVKGATVTPLSSAYFKVDAKFERVFDL